MGLKTCQDNSSEIAKLVSHFSNEQKVYYQHYQNQKLYFVIPFILKIFLNNLGG